ncbi:MULTISPECIES: GNAT family N-acetyltransferase [Nocardia]|uniref:GNAT family N-acetyltransferase n=1 Tax=Nocardia TaxID=1817 RepID=UPI000BEFA197|nr:MULTISPECIES: GNAT family N-acetyltransferase [Nocardia]PEH79455.1 acetyltransferase [Nocardia sp. FDAARGOS_372]
MVELRYLTECPEAVQSKVRTWAGTEEFAKQVAPDFVLGYEPGVETGVHLGNEVRPGKSRRQHNWVIFADDQPVGVVFASIQDQPDPDSAETEDPTDYPCLGTATYIDLSHRGRKYASASKQAISEHEVARGVRSFRCMIRANNPDSLSAIEKAGYECFWTEHVPGEADRLHFRRRIEGRSDQST